MPKHFTSSRNTGNAARAIVDPHFKAKYCKEKKEVSSEACSGRRNWFPPKTFKLLFRQPEATAIASSPIDVNVLSSKIFAELYIWNNFCILLVRKVQRLDSSDCHHGCTDGIQEVHRCHSFEHAEPTFGHNSPKDRCDVDQHLIRVVQGCGGVLVETQFALKLETLSSQIFS